MKKYATLMVPVIFSFCALLQESAVAQTSHIPAYRSSAETGSSLKSEPFPKLDTSAIIRIMSLRGKYNAGEYKITIPQNDLSVEVDHFRITPPMGLSSWIGFTPAPTGAMIMGDIVLTESDLQPVQQEVIRQGLEISALHNHFVRNHPNILYMHIGGSGKTEVLAEKVRAILNKLNEVRGHDPSQPGTPNHVVTNTINTKELDNILGLKGEMSGGVYKYVIGRPDVPLKEHGVPVSSFMGFNTWIAFQGTMENAAVAGDFTMLENEVNPVIRVLTENGIEVVAVHNHMVHEEPRIFFLHYWGVGNAAGLAGTLRKALNKAPAGTVEKMKM